MAYNLTGYVVTQQDKGVYDFFGYPATSPADVRAWLDSDDPDRTLYINSYGGNMFAGVEIFHLINGKADVVITGLAASIASVIAMGGKTVKINTAGEIMMHNVQGYVEGDYRDMEKGAEDLKVADQSIRNAYRSRANVSDQELAAMMDAETWLTAQKAKEYGLVDEVLFEKPAAAVDYANLYKGAAAFYNCVRIGGQPTGAAGRAAKQEKSNAADLSVYRKRIENNLNFVRSV